MSAGSGSSRRRMLIAWAFLLPNFIGFAIFTAGPVLFSLWMAFTDWSLTKHNELTNRSPSFIGFENFRRILWGDESHFFWTAFYNTAYLLIGIPIGIAGSLLVALMLNRPIGPQRVAAKWKGVAIALVVGMLAAGSTYLVMHPGPAPTREAFESSAAQIQGEQAAQVTHQQVLERHQLDVRSAKAAAMLLLTLGVITAIGLGGGVVVFRTIFYLPSLLAGIALFLLWKSLYKPTGGAINELLRPVCDWLQDAATGTPAGLWYGVGVTIWIVGALGCGWLVWLSVRKRLDADFGSLSLVGSALAIAAIAATGFGIGYALCQMPTRSLFATGYATFSTEEASSIRADLLAGETGLSAAEIDLIFDTLGESIEPRLLSESLASSISDESKAQLAIGRVMARATPVHDGFTSGDGLQPPRWLVDERWAKPALILMGVWTAVGGANMLLFLAGLSNVPPELLEAAEIDGAGTWRRFWNVTWPQLAPTTFFIVIMSTIGGLQGGFDQARAMTQGKYGTEVLTYYIYNLAFTDEFQLGLASAVAWAMFAIIFAMTVLNYGLGNRALND